MRILIVRTSAIGDVIQTLLAFEYLRRRFPHAKIDWVVEQGIAPLVRRIKVSDSHTMSLSGVDEVLELDTQAWGKDPFADATIGQIRAFYRKLRSTSYDLVFDLQGNIKSGIITKCARASEKVGFGWNSVREKLNVLATTKQIELPADLNIRHKYLGLVQRYFNDEGVFESSGLDWDLEAQEESRLNDLSALQLEQKPLIMVSVGSKWENKRLDRATLSLFLTEVAAWKNPTFLYTFGNEEEREAAQFLSERFPGKIVPVGDLSLPLWQRLMSCVDAVIAVDSAALHLAATTSTPTFSVFGPTAATVFAPVGPQHAIVQAQCPYGKAFVKQCPSLRSCPTGACIKGLSADQLFATFKSWYSSLSKST